MRYKKSGATGLFVSEFCLGTVTVGTPAPPYAAAGGMPQDVPAVEQLEVNLVAAHVQLTDEERASPSQIGASSMEYRGWMIANDSLPRQSLMDTGMPSEAWKPCARSL